MLAIAEVDGSVGARGSFGRHGVTAGVRALVGLKEKWAAFFGKSANKGEATAQGLPRRPTQADARRQGNSTFLEMLDEVPNVSVRPCLRCIYGLS